MTIYRATAPFFADGMCHPVRLDAVYERLLATRESRAEARAAGSL